MQAPTIYKSSIFKGKGLFLRNSLANKLVGKVSPEFSIWKVFKPKKYLFTHLVACMHNILNLDILAW